MFNALSIFTIILFQNNKVYRNYIRKKLMKSNKNLFISKNYKNKLMRCNF